MKTNLFLLAIIVAGGWYLWNMGAPVPEAQPTVVVAQPTHRADYSQARTYYSPLNDPPVPATTSYSSNVGSAANGVYNRSSALTLGNTSSGVTSSQPGVSLSGSRAPSYTSANGDPTLNIQRRANTIGDAAKGDQ